MEQHASLLDNTMHSVSNTNTRTLAVQAQTLRAHGSRARSPADLWGRGFAPSPWVHIIIVALLASLPRRTQIHFTEGTSHAEAAPGAVI